MRTERLLVIACLAGILLACGQKGPLVLPDAQHPHKKVGMGKPPASSAPASSEPTSAPAGAAPATAAPNDVTAPGDTKTLPTPSTPQP